jgi:mRNA interferase MazF
VIPQQGEVWWAEGLDKRRPVLVLSRSESISVLEAILVVPITRTIRGIPSELRLGPAEGLPAECVAAFDTIQPVPWRGLLIRRTGTLAPERMWEFCEAFRATADC